MFCIGNIIQGDRTFTTHGQRKSNERKVRVMALEKNEDEVTSDECLAALRQDGVGKSSKQITQAINDERQSRNETPVKESRVKKCLNGMTGLSPPLVVVRTDVHPHLYSTGCSPTETRKENDDVKETQDKTVPIPSPQQAARNGGNGGRHGEDRTIGRDHNFFKKCVAIQSDERFPDEMKLTEEEIAAFTFREAPQELEKAHAIIRAAEIGRQEALNAANEELGERLKKTKDLEAEVTDQKKKVAELQPKAAALDELLKVMPQLTADNLRTKQRGWQAAEDSAVKARRWVWILSIVLVVLVVAIGGYAAWRQREGVAPVIVEAPVER